MNRLSKMSFFFSLMLAGCLLLSIASDAPGFITYHHEAHEAGIDFNFQQPSDQQGACPALEYQLCLWRRLSARGEEQRRGIDRRGHQSLTDLAATAARLYR